MNKSIGRREETCLLCQQEFAEGQTGDLLLEGYLGRRCHEVGDRLRDHAERGKKEAIKELALTPGV